jgi:hypothetical protein
MIFTIIRNVKTTNFIHFDQKSSKCLLLRHLTIELTKFWCQSDLGRFNVQQKYLPQLVTLYLTVATHQACSGSDISPAVFLNGLASPKLKCFGIKSESDVTENQFLDLLRRSKTAVICKM